MTDTILLDAGFLHFRAQIWDVDGKAEKQKSFLLLMKDEVGGGETMEEAMVEFNQESYSAISPLRVKKW